MKKSISLLILTVAFFLLPISNINSQDDPFKACKEQISSDFILNSQPLQAFLTGDEVAEFKTTFLSGSVYRISACSASDEPILFSVFDTNHNLLFSNSDYQNAKYWDFKMAGSMECIIEARLDESQKSSGMALLYIGFQKLDEE